MTTKHREHDDDDDAPEDHDIDEPKGFGRYLSGKALQAKLDRDRAEWAVERKQRETRGEWWKRPPIRTGAGIFTVAIRAPDDPERKPRPKKMADDPSHSIRWKNINKVSAEEWSRAIVKHLSDGKTKTFNAISVELAGTTADIAVGKNLEAGLWLAVERGELEYTPQAPVLFRLQKRGRAVGPEYVPPRAPPKPKSPRVQKEITTQEAKREFERLGTGKTVQPAPPQKKIKGFAVYDLITIKKQEAGRRLPPFLLDTARTLDEAQKIAKQWTLLTGHSTTVKQNGVPVANFDWNEQMTALYTKGWVRLKTAVTDGQKFGVFYYARPATNQSAGYEASVLWDNAQTSVWVPLTSLTKVPSVPAKKAPVARAAPVEKHRHARPAERRVTAEHFTDPVLGGAERRLAESVEEAIRLYGTPRKRR